MDFAGWVRARAAAYRWTLAFLFLLASLTTMSLTAMTGHLDSATAAGVRQAIEGAEPAARAVQLSTALASNPAIQTAAAARLFDRVFRGVSVQIDESAGTGPVPVVSGGARGTGLLALGEFPDIGAHTRVVSGRWPAPQAGGFVPLAMTVDAAADLDLRVGDRLSLEGGRGRVAATLTAVLQPTDLGDPYLLQGGVEGDSATAAVVASLRPFTDDIQTRWTISPGPSFDASQVNAMRSALVGLRAAANNDLAVNTGTIQQNGQLADTLAVLGAGLAAARAVTPIPILLVGALGLLLIAMALILLAAARRIETGVLRSRGVSRGRLAVGAAAEAGLVCAAATATGVAGAALVGPISLRPTLLTIAIVLGVAVSTAATAGFRNPASPDPPSPRARLVVAAGPAILLIAAAAVGMWRFRRLGSAVAVDAIGVPHIDPVAVLAPVLCLLAIALVGTAAAGLLAGTVTAGLNRRRGTAVLPAREVYRRWPIFGTVSLLIALAVAGIATAAAFDSTWDGFRASIAQVDNVADVRVVAAGVADLQTGAGDPAAAYTRIPGVVTATDALVTATGTSEEGIELMATPAARMAGVLPSIAGGFDAGEAGRLLAGDRRGLALPTGTSRLQMQLAVSATLVSSTGKRPKAPLPADISIVAWFTGPQGTVLPVSFGGFRVPVRTDEAAGGSGARAVTQELSAPVPPGASSDWRIAALDTVIDTDTSVVLRVDIVRIDALPSRSTSSALPTPVPVGEVWTVRPVEDLVAAPRLTGRPIGSIGWTGVVPPATPATTVRMMPGPPTGNPVPIVVNTATAALLGLVIGDAVDLQLAGTARHVRAVVAGTSRVLPGGGTGPRVLADLGAVSIQLLSDTTSVPAANQIWLQSNSPSSTAAAARTVAGADATVTAVGDGTSSGLVRPVVVVFWVAAITSVVLAVLALATLAVTLSRQRRAEVVVLRSLGLLRRQQMGARRAELAAAGVTAVIVGAAAGAINARLTIAGLARSAVVDSPFLTPALAVAPAGWLVLAVGLAGGALVVLAAGVGVGRQARAEGTGEVTG